MGRGRYDEQVKLPVLQLAGAVVAGVATPIVIVAAAVILFLNPFWVSFEQGRSDVTAWTGYTAAQVDEVTGAILSDLVFGPPTFDVTLDGKAVLAERERVHMADVRGVFAELGLLAIVAALLLLLTGVASRGRRWFWRAAATGATALVVGVVVAGVGAVLFFDAIFELFHEIFFAAGTYMFNPSTDKLVQLFPDQFWSDTTIALGVVIVILSLIVRGVAEKLADRGLVDPAPDGSAA
jgi:integral membrane protein (TIGR01906 family)